MTKIKDDFIKQIYHKADKQKSLLVFLDRDGTIMREVQFVKNINAIHIYKNTIEAIRLLNKLNCLVVIVTNQPIIARGWINIRELKNINDFIYNELLRQDAAINAIYSCPHHPEAALQEYRINCLCRKPGFLMLDQAINDFDADVKKCYIIGDQTSDIKAGINMGIQTILVKTGLAGKDKKYRVKPGRICCNLLHAIKYIGTETKL